MINSRDLSELHPTVRRLALELKSRMKSAAYELGFSSTFRDNEYQDFLYKKGNVTRARGGQSIHNYRLAFDIFQNIKGREYESGFLAKAGQVGTELGLEWGGNWKGFVDRPHFQWTGGLSLRDLQNGKMPKEITLPWEKMKEEVKQVEVSTTKILINGEEYTINRILKDGKNYIELRELEKAGFVVGYDENRKMPVISV